MLVDQGSNGARLSKDKTAASKTGLHDFQKTKLLPSKTGLHGTSYAAALLLFYGSVALR